MAVRGGSRRENQTTLETYEKHADSSIRRMAGTPREAVCAWRDEGVLDLPCHAQILEIGDGPGRDARYIESRAQRTAKRRRGAVYPLPLARETRSPSPERSHGSRRGPFYSMLCTLTPHEGSGETWPGFDGAPRCICLRDPEDMTRALGEAGFSVRCLGRDEDARFMRRVTLVVHRPSS